MEFLNVGLVVLCGVGFHLVFVAFGTVQNLATEVLVQMGYDDFGFYQLSVIYIMFMLGSFFNTPVVERLGPRLSMFWGALGYVMWVVSALFPALRAEVFADSEFFLFQDWFIYGVMLFCACLNGLGASIYFVGQGKYIAMCANESNKGRFQSIFQIIFKSSSVSGSLFGAFLLGSFSLVSFFSAMGAIGLFGAFTALLLTQPKEPKGVASPRERCSLLEEDEQNAEGMKGHLQANQTEHEWNTLTEPLLAIEQPSSSLED